MRISDWSSDVCSSDLQMAEGGEAERGRREGLAAITAAARGEWTFSPELARQGAARRAERLRSFEQSFDTSLLAQRIRLEARSNRSNCRCCRACPSAWWRGPGSAVSALLRPRTSAGE